MEPAKFIDDHDTLTTNYLELKGIINKSKGIKECDEPLNGVLIKIYKDGKFLGARVSIRNGNVNFKLLLQSEYKLEVMKKGYVTKIIEVNTKINRMAIPEKKQKPYYEFPFSVDIFEEIDGLNVSVLKKPIAKIAYNYKTHSFEYDNTYTHKINSDLKKMYKDYYALLMVGADSLVTNKGDNCVYRDRKRK